MACPHCAVEVNLLASGWCRDCERAYGIWGHDLQDLVVTAARWTRQSDGTVQIELHVES